MIFLIESNKKVEHKTFISYYHEDDQIYKDYIDLFLSSNIINKSVKNGDINTYDSIEYTKRLIRDDYISDSSVIVVLIGENTKTRKYVDWEIYAGLMNSNGNSGLLGIILPSITPTEDEKYYYDDMPPRFADNLKSGYAKLYTWDDAKNNFESIIETAFNDRIKLKDKIDNSRLQMKNNTTGYYNK